MDDSTVHRKVEKVMLKPPDCEFCKYHIIKDEKDCCRAYPEGIPLRTLIKSAPGVECAPGYVFEPKEEEFSGEKRSQDGLLSRFLK